MSRTQRASLVYAHTLEASEMMAKCCLSGFEWEGTPIGTEATLANNNSYVTGSNSDVAVLVITDLFGWTFINERLLSDHYAKEVDATVYMPDLYVFISHLPHCKRHQFRRESANNNAALVAKSLALRFSVITHAGANLT